MSTMFPAPIFFPELRMNFAEHLLNSPSKNRVWLYDVTEGASSIRNWTQQEIRGRVRSLADAMVQAGLRKGDRVAAVISNCVEAVIACLATLSLGAIWSTTAPDMGIEGIMQRLEQIEPKIVFFESSVRYNGKIRSLTHNYKACLARLRKVRNFHSTVLIVRDEPYQDHDTRDSMVYEHFLRTAKNRPLTFEQVPFSHPGFIVYSSGTVSCISDREA